MSIEQKSIDYVPEYERHGRAIDQAPFWFLGNFQFLTVAIGFVGPAMGLSLGYTALAATLGILFGTIFAAFHASQGAELGLPQMIQSRAQFGFRGVSVVLLGTLFTFIGFNVADSVLIAQGTRLLLGWNSAAVILAAALVATIITIYGHDWLHRVFRWCFWGSLPLYAFLTLGIASGHVPATHVSAGGFTWVAFLSQFAGSAAYNITYAPSVSDYSRYLPRATPARQIIAAVFLGAATSAIWLILLGAWLATRLGAEDSLVALRDAGEALQPGFGLVMALGAIVALTVTMALNAYSGMLTIVTGMNSLFEMRPTQRLRIGAILAIAAVWVLITLAISGNAITLVEATLALMLYLLVPWTAVNLVDYFFVRRGRYAITHLFMPHGIYGAWGARGLCAYALGFLATLPFLVLPELYSGPAARALGGVDVGWVVGLSVSGGSYWLMCRRLDLAREAGAIRESDGLLARLPAPPEATAGYAGALSA